MEDVVSLTNLNDDEVGVIAYTVGGFGLVRRLAEMGLTPGVKVRVLRKGPFRGPFEIEVRGVMLALGYGVASRVFVRVLTVESDG
jgi:ferrous iron transport protein A